MARSPRDAARTRSSSARTPSPIAAVAPRVGPLGSAAGSVGAGTFDPAGAAGGPPVLAPSSAASGEVCSLRAASIDPSALESCISSMDPIVTARGETLAWSRIADSTFPH